MARWSQDTSFITFIHYSKGRLSDLIDLVVSLKKCKNQYFFLNQPISSSEQTNLSKNLGDAGELDFQPFNHDSIPKKGTVYYSLKSTSDSPHLTLPSEKFIHEVEKNQILKNIKILAVVLRGHTKKLIPKLSFLKTKNAYILAEEAGEEAFEDNLSIQTDLADAILERSEISNHLKKIFQGKFKTPIFSKLDSNFTQELIDNLQGVFFVFDQNGKMLLWNKKVNEVTGNSDEEIAVMDATSCFPENERKKVTSEIQIALLHGQSSLEANILHKNGTLKPHFFKASFIHFQNQPCLYGVGVDLTEQKQNLFEISMMLNNTDEAFLLIDRSLKIISSNKRFQEQYREFFGKNVVKFDSILNYTNPAKRTQLAEMYHQVLEGETFVTETQVTNKQGKSLIYEFTHKPAKNEIGDILGIFLSAKDVTFERKAKRQIQESEKKFKTLVQEGSDLIAVVDFEGKYKFISPNHETYLGFTTEEMVELTAFDLIHPDDITRVKSKFQILSQTKRVTSHPYRVKHKAFGYRWIQSTATNLFEDPNIGGILVNSTDITDLVFTQKELEKSNELFHFIQKATKEAIFDWDIINDDFTWGEGFEKLFGHDYKNRVFRIADWLALIHPADANKEEARWNAFMERSDQVQWTNEFRFLDSKGTYQFVEEVAYLVRDKEGNPIRMIGSLREQSHKKVALIKNNFLAEIGQFFKDGYKTKSILEKVLNYIVEMSESTLGEIWLVNHSRESIKLFTFYDGNDSLKSFYHQTGTKLEFSSGEGLPGLVWQNKCNYKWQVKSGTTEFKRIDALKVLKVTQITSIPLFNNNEIIGVILLGNKNKASQEFYYQVYFSHLEYYLGAEIIRKQQQEELTEFFINSPDILAIADSSGYFRKVNPSFCKLLGFSDKELTEKPFVDFLHPDDLNTTNKEYRETISGLRQADNFVNRYRTFKGDYKWISWKSSKLFGDDGVAYAFGRDVTDRVKLNLLLEDSNRLAKLGSWEVDLLTGRNFWSVITCEIIEVPANFIPTLEAGINLYKEGPSREQLHKAVTDCIDKGIPFDLEVTLITFTGKEKWVRVIGKAEREAGQIVKISGSIQDISERKVAELELVKSNERFEKASMATNDAIWDYDVKTDSLYWTEGYRVLFGYDPQVENSMLSGWIEKIHPRDILRVSNSWEEILKDTSSEFWKEEYRYLKADGTYANVEDRGLIVRDEKGEAVRIVGAMSDITHRKEYEASLQRLNRDLKKQAKALEISNAELEQFAYVASHDLQEPLRMVSSFLLQLEKKYGNKLDEKAKQYIHFAVDGAKRMRQIILDLLDFSRVGKNEGDQVMIDLNEVVEEALLMHRKSIEEKKAQIHIDHLPKLKGYKTPFFQLFYNLINNAFKYSNDNIPLQLSIKVKELDDCWEFSVQDNGIGIEKEYFDRIFIIFQRLHGKDQYGGTGMGLSIVKKLVENFNGEVRVESEYGKGSTFYFSHPKNNT
ncbi:PAS domain-containing protein [Arthrospiribacter ruber]|uniref:histidine kinase n=1 Tax=Arthrospiribacter ruber TaxID=2487934 RepID=A0A951J0D8_9BACT|nr:PAS domain-containing protein [Arthrospiribacter ruber]MBW3468648.1 PAS domain S-box protein [Arthrospiribacter ruber]